MFFFLIKRLKNAERQHKNQHSYDQHGGQSSTTKQTYWNDKNKQTVKDFFLYLWLFCEYIVEWSSVVE